ncbi:hypothetical protein ACFU5Z_16305 [Streptomyces sp. NPDC057521]|uniref:hypothetical protein n=1 Tax=Streptomyces sp. NPDC057521 TaxID=3346156 RepID=UPI0036B2D9C1
MTIYREGLRVKARLDWSEPAPVASPDPRLEHGLSLITAPLRRRWLECTVEFGLSDYYVHAQLPEGGELIISPPQEPSTEHPPGRPDGWTVEYRAANSFVAEVIYDSGPDGPHARRGGSIPDLLAVINEHLDHAGAPRSPEQERVLWQRTAHMLLQQAGFIPGEIHGHEQHYRLLSTLDPAEEQRAVIRVLDRLDEVYVPTSYDDSLMRPHESAWTDEPGLGDRLDELAETIAAATHPREVLASVDEVISPNDGAIRRVVELLDTTATSWESLGQPAAQAIRLRDAAEDLQLQLVKLLALSTDMAGSAADRPGAPRASAAQPASTPRTRAALASSPTAAQHNAASNAPKPPDGRTQPPAPPAPPANTVRRR